MALPSASARCRDRTQTRCEFYQPSYFKRFRLEKRLCEVVVQSPSNGILYLRLPDGEPPAKLQVIWEVTCVHNVSGL